MNDCNLFINWTRIVPLVVFLVCILWKYSRSCGAKLVRILINRSRLRTVVCFDFVVITSRDYFENNLKLFIWYLVFDIYFFGQHKQQSNNFTFFIIINDQKYYPKRYYFLTTTWLLWTPKKGRECSIGPPSFYFL